jgi:hypothetical protein
MTERIKFLNGAFCPDCEAIVFDAYTTLSDDDALSAMERDRDVQLVHHPNFSDGTTADHSFSLTGPEKDRLRQQLLEHMART